MSEEKDYRVNYLTQHYKDKTFKIDKVENGCVTFVCEDGTAVDFKCALPRKITAIEDGTVIEVTKGRFSMKDAPKPVPLGSDRDSGAATLMQSGNTTPLGEQANG